MLIAKKGTQDFTAEDSLQPYMDHIREAFKLVPDNRGAGHTGSQELHAKNIGLAVEELVAFYQAAVSCGLSIKEADSIARKETMIQATLFKMNKSSQWGSLLVGDYSNAEQTTGNERTLNEGKDAPASREDSAARVVDMLSEYRASFKVKYMTTARKQAKDRVRKDIGLKDDVDITDMSKEVTTGSRFRIRAAAK